MPRPDGGLITETNRQYYAGAQQFFSASAGSGQTFTSTFDTDLVFGSSDPANAQFGLNNFKVFTSATALTWVELTPVSSQTTGATNGAGSAAGASNVIIAVANVNVIPGMVISNAAGTVIYGTVTTVTNTTTFACNITLAAGIPAAVTALLFKSAQPWSELDNIVTIASYLPASTYIKFQLSETALQQNYGNYEYTRLTDVIDNFLIAYVGAGKILPSVKRSDVIFHAKRGLQEFSYDTLRSIRSQEVTVNQVNKAIIPQDYVNYVRLSWTDSFGVQRTIFPANTLTTDPFASPVQDNLGVPTQDNFDSNLTGTSQTEAAWAANDPRRISGAFENSGENPELSNQNSLYQLSLGQRYGLNPETSQNNGWFTINEREGVFSFSSDLQSKTLIIEYISDGNAYDLDARIPKMAEDALYSHIAHGILSTMANTPEYIVQRYKRERSAKLRNAKIRLSNIKLDQIVQVMRGQSKWIKY